MPRSKKKRFDPVNIGKRFLLKRVIDSSGVSGVGYVAFGICMPSGKVIIEWLTETSSEAIYSSLEDCVAVHGHSGNTVIEWIDGCDLKLIPASPGGKNA